MNIYLIIILAVLVFDYLINFTIDKLNIKQACPVLPAEFLDVFDQDKYRKAQDYLKERTNFGILRDGFFLVVTVSFVLTGGFNYIDNFARSLNQGYIVTGLIFAGSVTFLLNLLNIPFSYYETFVIEEKFGFNKTNLKTFFSDILKNLFLGAVIGGIVFSFVVWFFLKTGHSAWLYSWLGVVVFDFFVIFISPVLILPLFYKFKPLEEGILRDNIYEYARSQDFALKDIYVVDASRRSSKSNAFFTGFGKNRRIALFDTLLEKHTVDELVSIIAHEVGHYKKKHVFQLMGIALIGLGLMFFLLSFFLDKPDFFQAFSMDHISIYAGIFFFLLLYTPVSMIFSVISNWLSRRNEFQADRFSVFSYGKPEIFIRALKKLSVDNLTNLTPHPGKVFLAYSHPPVLDRIRAIRKFKGQ